MMKKFLAISVFAVCLAAVLTSCGGENADVSPIDVGGKGLDVFDELYEAEFGSVFHFEYETVDGKPLEYKVTADGETVRVFNGEFVVSKYVDYYVSVGFVGDGSESRTFTVRPVDRTAPNIALSYEEKYVVAGERAVLPEYSVYDNRDETVSITAEAYFGGEKITVSGGEILTERGVYEYRVTATDRAGNRAEKVSKIFAGDELDTHVAIGWANAESVVYYAADMVNVKTGVDERNVMPGMESSFSIDFIDPFETRCVTFANSLIHDMSDYEYLVFYAYNGMTEPRMLSFNWTSVYSTVINSGMWTPVVFPVSEDLVAASYNTYLREHQDWTKLDGMRLYIQNSPAANGKFCLSDVYLMNSTTADEFAAKANDYLLGGGTTFKETDIYYNILKAQGVDDIALYKQCVRKYLADTYGDEYGEDVIVGADKPFASTWLCASGDRWSCPKGVKSVTDEKYGDEKGAIEVTVGAGKRYSNLALSFIPQSGIKSGMIEFYLKNATSKPLEIYTNRLVESGSPYPVSAEDGWQRIVLPVPDDVDSRIGIYVRGAGEGVIDPANDRKFYISDVRVVTIEDKGEYFDVSDEVQVASRTRKWIAEASVSDDVEYDGKPTMKIDASSDQTVWGSTGILVNTDVIAVLLKDEGVKSVKVSFKYYVASRSAALRYITMAGPGNAHAAEVQGDNAWYDYSTEFSSAEDNTIIALTQTVDLTWRNSVVQALFYVADIRYEAIRYEDGEDPVEVDKAKEYFVEGDTYTWQKPQSVETTSEEKHGDSEYSYKVGFKPGYKYATVFVYHPTEASGFSSGKIEFYIKNPTGKAIEVYTDPSEWSGVVKIESGDEWQKVSLYADPTDGVEYVKVCIRGAGEQVVDENAVRYFYVSEISSGVNI